MIHLSEISENAEKFRIPAETIEKDYVISWILFCLSRSDLRDDFIFYGGTAIKRVYFEDHRFSEDIDFLSSGKFNLEYFLKQLKALQCAKQEANLNLELHDKEISSDGRRIKFIVHYSAYDEIIGSPKEISLDFSMGMQLYGKSEKHKIIQTYSDPIINNEFLLVSALNSILGTKLGMLLDLTRNEPRDLFDIWFLFQKINEFDFNLGEVCDVFRNRCGFSPSAAVIVPRLENKFFKLNWENRLRKQVADLPQIETVIYEVQEILERLFDDN